MSRRCQIALRCSLLLACLVPSVAAAQAVPPASQTVATGGAAGTSHLWLVAGGAFATVRGDCQTCEEDFPYRHSGSVLANVGYRVNDRMDVGGELFWMPMDADQTRVNTTHVDAVAQFRPWASQGFFVKGGAGMAFVRNWVDATGPSPLNSTALSVVIGTGWAFRPAARIGLQLFGAQHVAALADIRRPEGDIPDVVGNFWSIGAAIVIR